MIFFVVAIALQGVIIVMLGITLKYEFHFNKRMDALEGAAHTHPKGNRP